jgi:hypothetical protein
MAQEYKGIVDEDGTIRWFRNGKSHRVDGPAVEWADGTKGWLLNGKLHRTNGPAIEYSNGTKSWYLNGKKVTEHAVMNSIKEMTVTEIEALLGYSIKIIAG